MQNPEKIKISRDCQAMMIPSGLIVTLAKGNEVEITHKLGGNFTVVGLFGMARIEGKDADALGDPEIPVNIVDLGLVYRMELLDAPDGKKRVEADITLTAPGCAMGPAIADDLKMRLESLAGIESAKVDIVWDPPWHQDMMSEEARMILGLA